MDLTEKRTFKKAKNKELYVKMDNYCYLSKNLYNATNYIIKQSYRIHQKIKDHKLLEPWESELLFEINKEISEYNRGKEDNKRMQYIDNFNGFMANAYFLSWYMLRHGNDFRAMPYSNSAQICIQNLCKNWKSFYKSMKEYKKDRSKFNGKPNPPKYLDKNKGRGSVEISGAFIESTGETLNLPKFLSLLHIRTDKKVKLLRIRMKNDEVVVEIVYEATQKPEAGNPANVMAIDLGVNNLCAITFSTEAEPVVINGRPLKSINQYYNKRRAELQSVADKNGHKTTNRIKKLTGKRNNKVKDFLHKTSRIVVDLAVQNGISEIIIGKNKNWKQEVSMGKVTNQNFVSIPFDTLINYITYKAELEGIKVVLIDEAYTSGTSCLDNEKACKKNYNKSRRKQRGLFVSNDGRQINADVNASYQIMRNELSINICKVETVHMRSIPHTKKKKPA